VPVWVKGSWVTVEGGRMVKLEVDMREREE